MVRGAPNRGQSKDGTPGAEPSVTPPFSGSHDHSFTLQAIMELQKSNGQVSADIKTLTASIDKLSGKVEKIEDKVSAVTHKLYAAGVVLAILLVVGGWIINKAWDMAAGHISDIAKAAIQQQAANPGAASQVPGKAKQ